MPESQELSEAFGSLADVQRGPTDKRRFKTLLIKEGWGSSGYYSAAVLKRDGPSCWPKGTFQFLDHPTVEEQAVRPEGSVRNLASVTVSHPVWDDVERGLVAEVEVFPQWADLLNEEYAKAIGLSIRATGTVEYGEAEGRKARSSPSSVRASASTG